MLGGTCGAVQHSSGQAPLYAGHIPEVALHNCRGVHHLNAAAVDAATRVVAAGAVALEAGSLGDARDPLARLGLERFKVR